jgi:predicted transcriptional regulator
MAPTHPPALSRRERQIMDVVYRREDVTAAQIHVALPDRPTYTTVRGLLRVLVEKGHLRFRKVGRAYLYSASTPRDKAGASTIAHVVRTFFRGSPADAMAALLGAQTKPLTEIELKRLAALVNKAARR